MEGLAVFGQEEFWNTHMKQSIPSKQVSEAARKTAVSFVLYSVLMLNAGWAAVLRPGTAPTDGIRIVANLEEAAGGPVRLAVLVFFALDCPVCWEELFEVRYVTEKLSLPVALIGISAESAAELEPFLAKHAFFYPVVSDRGRELFRRFRVRLEPFVVVLDGDRVIYQDNTSEGMDTRRENLKRCLLEISAKRPS